MKTLELNRMEIIDGGGPCDGQIAAFALANVSVVAATLAGGPFGFALATASFMVALTNLNNCYDANNITANP